MKRRDLETHLRRHGCEILREGANHTIFINEATSAIAAASRHAEIKTPTVRAICRALDIPLPAAR